MRIQTSLIKVVIGIAFALLAAPAPLFAQRDLTDIPTPDPAAELEAMNVAEQVQVNLFARDPQIRKPIQSNFDAAGRLWVASSEAYPQLAPGETANDKIIVLEDSDGDGVAEKSTVFQEGLLMPTGVIPDGLNACYVAHATELLHLEDTDGDGKADVSNVVLSGFGTEDTHHLIHTLRWGPDGCLYFNQSIYIHSTIETAYGVERLDGGGIWRYRPETGELEVLCKGFVNPWGHVFDAYGQSLVTDGAYFEGINHAFPDAVFVTSPGATRWLRGMNPGSPKHCGLTILSGAAVPEAWQGALVTNDFRSHRVCRFSLQRDGSTFDARQQPEIITTEHVAFRPIDAAMGGDGALYIADWYNPIIQHGEVDFRDPRRDREHGRIWRVSFPGQPSAKPPKYSQLNESELIGLTRNDSLTVRQFARLELKRRDPKSVLSVLGPWISETDDPVEREHRVLEGIWIYECLDQVSPELLSSAFGAQNERIRAAAVRTIGNRRGVLEQADRWLAEAVHDSSGLVRLEAVAALGRGSRARDVEVALEVLDHGPLDDHLDFALWTAVRNLQDQWAPKLAESQLRYDNKMERLVFLFSAAGTAGAAEPLVHAVESADAAIQLNTENAGQLIVPLAGVASPSQLRRLVITTLRGRDWDDEQRGALLDGLLNRTAQRGVVPEQIDPEIAQALASADSLVLRRALIRAAATWKLASAANVIAERLSAQASDELGNLMADALGKIGTPQALAELRRVTSDTTLSADLRASAAVALVAPSRDQGMAAIKMLMEAPATRASMLPRLSEVLQRKGMFGPVQAMINTVSLGPDEARRLVAIARNASAPDSLIETIRRAGKLEQASWVWTTELSGEILALAKAQGDPHRGEEIYRRANMQCIKCHQIGDAGGLVGPNLVSLGGAADAEYILRSLIEPNDKLKEGFASLRVLTLDGRVIQGIPVGSNDETLQLRDAEGKVIAIPKSEIDAESPGQSLMPVGLVDPLSKAELADLTTFLGALGRVPEFTVSTRRFIRSVEKLDYNNEANRRLNRTSSDSVTLDEAILQWSPLTSRVNGVLPVGEIDTYQQHRDIPPTAYIRFPIDVPASGSIVLKFSTNPGTQMWVDGRPTPFSQTTQLQLDPGSHTIHLGLDTTIVKDGVAIEVVD